MAVFLLTAAQLLSLPSSAQTAESLQRQITAAERQRHAVAEQTAKKPLTRLPWWGQPVVSDADVASGPCNPLDEQTFKQIIESASTSLVSPHLIAAMIDQESGRKPCALSPKGAMGLMQLMPSTAGEMGLSDPYDAAGNVRAGVRYLESLLARFDGNLELALAAYNAGPARVETSKGVPRIAETQLYVESILRRLKTTADVSN